MLDVRTIRLVQAPQHAVASVRANDSAPVLLLVGSRVLGKEVEGAPVEPVVMAEVVGKGPAAVGADYDGEVVLQVSKVAATEEGRTAMAAGRVEKEGEMEEEDEESEVR
ncbi:hypothetical protein AB1Y20_020909 [Prymnesium parvum]|uniref:Uncharacterized protein n=1 Tax=Prymnesium parvum TaxID=97485 RepID=A0AB34JK15_PRYPA